MKKFFIWFICCFICFGTSFSFAYDEADLIDAINKTYKVNGEDFKLPSSLRNKITNYIKAKEITEEQSNSLMGILDEAVTFANKVGTTDINKISPEDFKKGAAIVNKAASILDMEVKVNSTLDTLVASDKSTGKIVEEVEKKDIFFKKTGEERNIAFWCIIGFSGLILIIILYIVLLRVTKFKDIDFLCNTILILYIMCGLPIICFGNYIEILDLLEPVLASKVGEGHIDIVDVEIKPSQESSKINQVENDNNSIEDVAKNGESKIEPIKYPVLGEMYAKLNIPDCDINLSVYYGDNDKILDAGVGHFSGSHFPGQGKGILYTTHNTKDKLYNLKDIKIGNKISVLTNFGDYNYKVTDIKIIKDTDKSKAYIESNKEILMIYTCYPFDSNGYTDERYMVYCERSDI